MGAVKRGVAHGTLEVPGPGTFGIPPMTAAALGDAADEVAIRAWHSPATPASPLPPPGPAEHSQSADSQQSTRTRRMPGRFGKGGPDQARTRQAEPAAAAAVTVFGAVDPPSRDAKRQGDLGSCDTVHA